MAAMAAGATPAVAQDPSREHTPDPAIADGSAQRALDRARATWKRTGATSYRFRVRRSCFCPPDVRGPVTVTVRNGRPQRPPEAFADVATVPRLHRVVQRAIRDEVADLDVRYDRRGMPVEIFSDGRRAIADDELGYAADRFGRLPRRR